MEALLRDLFAALDECEVAIGDSEGVRALATCRDIATRMAALSKGAFSASPRSAATFLASSASLLRLAEGGRRSVSGPLLVAGGSRRVVLVQTDDQDVEVALRKIPAVVLPVKSAANAAQALRDLALDVDIVLFDWPSARLLERAETSQASFVALVLPTQQLLASDETRVAMLAAHPFLADVVFRSTGADAVAAVVRNVLARRNGVDAPATTNGNASAGNAYAPTVGNVEGGSAAAAAAAASTSAMIAEADALRPVVQGATKSFLICDDNDANVLFAEYLLRRTVPGCTIDLCYDGNYAVEECQKRKYDLILVDLHMPRLDGIEACQRIKAGVLNHKTPIICMTSDTDTLTNMDVRAAGMVEVLTKPFSDMAFARVVQKWCLAVVPAADTAAAAAPADSAPNVVAPLVLNRTALASVDAAFRQRLLASWKRGFPAVFKGLETARAAFDNRTVASLAHGLKGSSAQVGAMALADMARWLQEDATRATPESLARLQALFDETVVECDAAFGT